MEDLPGQILVVSLVRIILENGIDPKIRWPSFFKKFFRNHSPPLLDMVDSHPVDNVQ